MPAFQIALDIVNRGLQGIGVSRILSLLDRTPAALEANFCYDKLRDAELRRNTWRFAIKGAMLRAVDASTVIWTPAAWAAATTYAPLSVVSYTPANLQAGQGSTEFGSNPLGYYWQCDASITGAAGNSTPDVDVRWHRYFGPITCDPYVAAPTTSAPPNGPTLGTTSGGSLGQQTIYGVATYVTGSGESMPSNEVTITVSADNLYTVASPPAQTGATGWNWYANASTGTEILQNSTPIAIGTSFIEADTGLVSGGRGAPVTPIPSYSVGELTVQGGSVYLSLIMNNQDVPPTPNWLSVGGTTAPLAIVYPIGAGPATQTFTSNAFRLPYGFLRLAPSDPRSDYLPWLGAPTAGFDTDWVIEGDYLVSRQDTMLMLRFVADVIDVWQMDPMFCEGLAARVGREVAQTPEMVPLDRLSLTLSNANRRYDQVMDEARRANAVLIGSEAPPIDEYIAVRW
jgi:hypothetical protein